MTTENQEMANALRDIDLTLVRIAKGLESLLVILEKEHEKGLTDDEQERVRKRARSLSY